MCTFKQTQLMADNNYHFLCNYNKLKKQMKNTVPPQDGAAKFNSFPNALKVKYN